jgi:predicted transcriptional regulator
MPPDTPAGPLTDIDAGERRALQAAVAEALASVEAGRATPHTEVRAELLAFIARARQRIAELDWKVPP